MRKMSWIVAAAMAVASAGLLAQGRSRAGTGNPVSESLRRQWASVSKNITQSAEMMPESGYGFKPVDTVRTFGQVVAHVAGANYLLCSAAKGEKKPPYAEDEFEKTLTAKADIVRALTASLVYCDGQFTALDDKSGTELVDLPFGMPKTARAGALMMNIGHMNEHYGNLVTYFRIKGMVPPSSQTRSAPAPRRNP
jgi:uncharacterized damage-inducible protein DinB